MRWLHNSKQGQSPLDWGLGIEVRHGPCPQGILQLRKDDPQVKRQFTLTNRLWALRGEAWSGRAWKKRSGGGGGVEWEGLEVGGDGVGGPGRKGSEDEQG